MKITSKCFRLSIFLNVMFFVPGVFSAEVEEYPVPGRHLLSISQDYPQLALVSSPGAGSAKYGFLCFVAKNDWVKAQSLLIQSDHNFGVYINVIKSDKGSGIVAYAKQDRKTNRRAIPVLTSSLDRICHFTQFE